MIWQVVLSLVIAVGGIGITLALVANRLGGKEERKELFLSWIGVKKDYSWETEFFGFAQRPAPHVTTDDLLDSSIADKGDKEEVRLALLKVSAMRNADALIADLDAKNEPIPHALLSAREEIDCLPTSDKDGIRRLVVVLNTEVQLVHMGLSGNAMA